MGNGSWNWKIAMEMSMQRRRGASMGKGWG